MGETLTRFSAEVSLLPKILAHRQARARAGDLDEQVHIELVAWCRLSVRSRSDVDVLLSILTAVQRDQSHRPASQMQSLSSNLRVEPS